MGSETDLITGELNWSFDPTSFSESLKHRSAEDVVGEIYSHLRTPIHSFLRTSLGCSHLAEDITQEVFVRLHEELQRGATIQNLRSWSFTVAHNLAVDSHRKEGRDRVSEGMREAGEADNPEELLLAEERHRKMGIALRRLSVRERQCLELRAEGLRYREIAEVLQVTIPAVQSFLARAIAKLKEDR